MRSIDADELKTAFPCGQTVRTECVRATIDHMSTITASAQDGWDLVFKILRLEDNEAVEFGLDKDIEKLSYEEAKKRYKKWEDKYDIHVGDVVFVPSANKILLVTYIPASVDNIIVGIDSNGETFTYVKSAAKKTGRHCTLLAELLKLMKEWE